MKQWLKDAVFYEIYPQSFYDTNGDGIGDLKGIIEKLDYIKELGCNALWINPCFDSPFKDAGYDVRDYKLIAPRYGTNADAKALFETAHAKGIHVLLDLVPGHTSEEHAWFKESSKPEKNEYSDRYIWTDSCFSAGDGMPFIGGETDRNGTYILNFFKCQPALNYGYGKCREKWQMPTDAPGPRATVEAVKDVMRFWLDMGCDGFRVDMASSLVKNDTHHKKYTCAIWRDIAAMLDKEYPEAALLSEWNQPRQSLKNGFDMDFMLEWQGNGYSWLMRNYDGAIDSDPHNIGKLYLPVDDTADAPTVAAQQADPDSLWHTVQGVLNFRHSHRDLDSDAPFHVRFAPKAKGSYRPFAWERGKLICAVNPAREEAELPLKLEDGTRVLHVIGKAEVKGDELVLGAQSFAILG